MRRRVLIGVLACLLVIPAAASALARATGNRQSIDLETAAEHVYDHVAAVRTAESGGIILADSGLSWRTLRTTVPSGWSAAHLTVIDGLQDGSVVWEEDVFTPTRSGVRPLEVVETSDGVYARRSTETGCFGAVDLEGDGQVGGPLFAVFGAYQAPRYTRSTVTVTGTFPYAESGYTTVTETDTLARTSHLYLSVLQRFTGAKGSKLAAVESRSRFTTLRNAPPRPHISYCPVTSS